MYNRNNCPWWLDKNFIIFILILLYYSNNNDMFKPPNKNFLTPISPNPPEHTPNEEDIDKTKNKSSKSHSENINIIKNILNSLYTSNSQESTKSQNTKTPSDDNSYENSSSSINMNNNFLDSENDDYLTNNKDIKFHTDNSERIKDDTPTNKELKRNVKRQPDSFNKNINILINLLNSLKTSISPQDAKSQDIKKFLQNTSHKSSVLSNTCDNIPYNKKTLSHDLSSPSNINNNTDSTRSKTNDCKPNHHNRYSHTNNNQIENPKPPLKTILTKLPVVLSESVIQIDLEADIILEKPALEIKRSKKDVILTQAKLLPYVSNYNKETNKFHNGKLFLKGFIKNNIEYAAVDCTNNQANFSSYDNIQAGSIVHSTVDIPFDCVTEIKYIEGMKPIVNHIKNTKEVEIFKNCKLNCSQKSTLEKTPNGFCEKYYEDEIKYTDGFSIQLQDARILKVATEKYSCINEDSDTEKDLPSAPLPHLFNKITENLVLVIKLKVLQNQQLKVELLEPDK